MKVPVPTLSLSFTLHIELSKPIELGQGRAGNRRIIPIIGGTVSGEGISGEICNLGADWQTIHADGAAFLDARYAIRTHDGAVIEIVNQGTRFGPPDVIEKLAAGEDVDPDLYYMRTCARLETGDDRYQWVNHTLFVCAGIRRDSSVEMDYYRVN